MRAAAALAAGLVAAGVTGAVWSWVHAPVVGWMAGALLFLALTWLAVGRMDAAETASHATREDPTRIVADALVLAASLASLGGVALILLDPGTGGRLLSAVLGMGSVAVAWLVVHVLFTLRYAATYYGHPVGGIDFNGDDAPDYRDFAYVGFTIGMAFTVSDTAVTSAAVRRVVLRHAVLSYLFTAVVIAIAINLVSGLVAS